MPNSIFAGLQDRQTVLFVDADPDTLDIYLAMASAEGIGVELASSAHEAVALALLVRPDVIVFELVDRDGVKALTEIRENPLTRGIPVVAVDNPLSENLDEQVSQCAARISKPFNLEDLLRLLKVIQIGALEGN